MQIKRTIKKFLKQKKKRQAPSPGYRRPDIPTTLIKPRWDKVR